MLSDMVAVRIEPGAGHYLLIDVAPRRPTPVAQQPIGRFGEPEEIAAAVVRLCSPAARFMVGHDMRDRPKGGGSLRSGNGRGRVQWRLAVEVSGAVGARCTPAAASRSAERRRRWNCRSQRSRRFWPTCSATWFRRAAAEGSTASAVVVRHGMKSESRALRMQRDPVHDSLPSEGDHARLLHRRV
jgi:hypothetical protein